MPSGAPYWDEEEEPSILDTEEAFVAAREGIPGAQDAISSLSSAYKDDPSDKRESTYQPKTMEELMAEVPDMNEDKTDWGSLLSMAVPGAISGIAGATGHMDLAQGMGRAGEVVAEDYMQQRRDKQVEDLRRRQKVWDEANEAAKNLPPEILSDEKFAPLAQAAAALQKDMLDGKIDNLKSYQEFVTQHAMMRDDIDKLQAIKDAANEQAGWKAKDEYTDQRKLAQKQAMDNYLATGDESGLAGVGLTPADAMAYKASQAVEVPGEDGAPSTFYGSQAEADTAARQAEQIEISRINANRQYEAMQNAEAARRRDHALTLAALERGQTVDAMNSYQATVGNRIAQAKNAAIEANRQADPAFLDEEVRKAEMTALENDSETIMGFGFQSGLVTEGMDMGGIGSGEPSVTIRVPGRPPLQVDYPPAEQVEELRQQAKTLREQAAAMPAAGTLRREEAVPQGWGAYHEAGQTENIGLVQGMAREQDLVEANAPAGMMAKADQLEQEALRLSKQRAEVHRIVNDAVVATGQLKH